MDTAGEHFCTKFLFHFVLHALYFSEKRVAPTEYWDALVTSSFVYKQACRGEKVSFAAKGILCSWLQSEVLELECVFACVEARGACTGLESRPLSNRSAWIIYEERSLLALFAAMVDPVTVRAWVRDYALTWSNHVMLLTKTKQMCYYTCARGTVVVLRNTSIQLRWFEGETSHKNCYDQQTPTIKVRRATRRPQYWLSGTWCPVLKQLTSIACMLHRQWRCFGRHRGCTTSDNTLKIPCRTAVHASIGIPFWPTCLLVVQSSTRNLSKSLFSFLLWMTPCCEHWVKALKW